MYAVESRDQLMDSLMGERGGGGKTAIYLACKPAQHINAATSADDMRHTAQAKETCHCKRKDKQQVATSWQLDASQRRTKAAS
jgi:hypothetical protein